MKSDNAVVERLEKKLQEWNAETAERVRQEVAELIELADQDILDMARSRTIEQGVGDP